MGSVIARSIFAWLVVVLMASSCTGSDASPSSDVPTQPASDAPDQTPAGSDGEVQLPPPEQSNITMGGSGGYSSGGLPMLMAICDGIDHEYGLNVEFTAFSGASQAAQALLAEQVDVIDNSGGPAIASLATDSPFKLVYVTRHNLTDTIFSQPEVTSADELRGGSIAISSFGAQSHAGVLLALKSLGLTENDVTITQVGNDSARLAALQAGSVTASVNDAAQEDALVDAGFNVLVRLTEVEGIGGVALSSLAVPVEFIEENPNSVLALVAMHVRGSVLMREDPEHAAECLAEFQGVSVEDAQHEIDVVLGGPWEPIDGRCHDEVMEFTQSVLVSVNPEIADVDPTEACTNQFIDQLEDIGFMRAVGVPGY
jgi:ABC-type nitrate/sulfonate/bicarbonate transport system substrate-binding protein